MQWYYSKGGVQMGPVSLDELKAKLASGELARTEMVWREGMADWVAAGSVPELAVSAVSQPVSPVAGGAVQPTYQAAATYSQQSPTADIPNYLWQSIVVTIFCCWPFGIPAIIAAAKVDGLKARGDIHGAMAASASAKKWCLISVGAWVVVFVLYVAFAIIMAVAGGNSSGGFR